MNFKFLATDNLALVSTCLLAVLACGRIVACVEENTAAASPQVFCDIFAAGSSDRPWKIDQGDQPFGRIKRATDAAAPGLVFSAPGRATALAEWPAGIEPFDFWFDVDLTAGSKQPWRYNGLAVAICSAPPQEMTGNDIALATGFYNAGIGCALKSGPFYKLGDDFRKVAKFQNANLSPRYEINTGGAGGENYSLQWPKKNLAGMKLRCRIQRLPDNRARFEVYNADGDWSRPWWVGQTAIPAKYAAVPIRYVAVLTTEENPDIKAPPPHMIVEGRIASLQGWTGDLQPPTITGYTSGAEGLTDGREFTLTGTNFSPKAQVFINGAACQTRVVGPTALKAVAAGLIPEKGNRLQVVNAGGLSALYEPVVYAGLCLSKVEPRESLPKGGDVVTLRGGGFDTDTKVTFNGKPAEIVGRPASDAMRVKVPAGAAGLAKLSASKAGQAFSGEPLFGYAPHPYLLFKGQEGLETLRARFRDPAFANYRQAILVETDKAVAKLDDPTFVVSPAFNEVVYGAPFAYAMTGDARYKESLLSALQIQFDATEGKLPEYQPAAIRAGGGATGFPGCLHQNLLRDEFWIMNGAAFAIAYDALFAEFPPEARFKLQRYLDDHLANYRDRIAQNDWWYANNPSNTIAAGNSGGGIVALALRYSTPLSDSTANAAAGHIKKSFKVITDDGGCVEGNMYWNYGLGAQMVLGLCLENALGDDKGLLSDPRFPKLVHFVETQLGGDGNMFTFNDTQPWLNGGTPVAFCGDRFDQPLMRWTADEIARRVAAGGEAPEVGRPSYSVPQFVFRGVKPGPKQMPDLPTLAYLDVLNWGVLRSSPRACGAGLVVGIKGVGGRQTHHAQEDAGSFVLQSRGESFLIDPGYFQPTATEHTLPVIGEVSQGGRPGQILDVTAPATLCDAWESGPLRSIAVEATAAYRPKDEAPRATRVRRVLVLLGEKALIALDQVEPVKKDDKITSFFQCGFPAELLPGDAGFRIQGKKSDLIGLIDGPKGAAGVEGPVEWKNKTWVYGTSGVQWFRVKETYAFTPGQPRVTVLLPVDRGAAVPDVRVKRTANSISVLLPGATPVEFRNEQGIWKASSPQP